MSGALPGKFRAILWVERIGPGVGLGNARNRHGVTGHELPLVQKVQFQVPVFLGGQDLLPVLGRATGQQGGGVRGAAQGDALRAQIVLDQEVDQGIDGLAGKAER